MPYLWHIAPKSQNKEKKYPNKLPKTYGTNEEGQGQPDSDAEELYLCKFKVEGKPPRKTMLEIEHCVKNIHR